MCFYPDVRLWKKLFESITGICMKQEKWCVVEFSRNHSLLWLRVCYHVPMVYITQLHTIEYQYNAMPISSLTRKKYKSKLLITRSEMRNGIYPFGEFQFNRLQWVPGLHFLWFRAALQAPWYYLQLIQVLMGSHRIKQLGKYFQMYLHRWSMNKFMHVIQIVYHIIWCVLAIMYSVCVLSWCAVAEYQSVLPIFCRAILQADKDSCHN